MARNARAQIGEDLNVLADAGVIGRRERPRGRPAEGLIPLGSAIDTISRQARVDGAGGFPSVGGNSFPSFVARNRLLDVGFDTTRPGTVTAGTRTRGAPVFNPGFRLQPGGNFRGGSSSGGVASVGDIGQARGVFSLSAADRSALKAIGAIPGLGLPSLGVRALQGIFGPQFGVIGAETIAPRIGDPAFGRTVRGGSFGSNRGPGSRGSGRTDGFGGPR